MPVQLGRTHAMLRRLREAGTLPSPPRRVGRIPRRQLPDAIGREYTKVIVREVCGPARAAFAEVEAEVLELLAALRREQGRTDAMPTGGLPAGGTEEVLPRRGMSAFAAAEWRGRKARELIEKAARSYRRKLRPNELHAVAKKFGERTNDHARAQLDAQLRAAIGVPLSAVERPMQDRIGQWTAENVALVQTVPERYFDRLQDDVQEAFAGGTRPETLKAQLADRYDMSASDAGRIARDQTLKLSADLHHARMEALGVERAIWRTMRDGRVCNACFAREGREFPLAAGLDGVRPGECHPEDRCYSEPILDAFFRR